VNLADLYRTQQRENEAQQLLEKAVVLDPSAAEPIHALGLLKSRLGKQREALDLFDKAVALQPGTTRYSYVYGVALHSYGQADKAITVLTKAHNKSPADRDVLMALITFYRDKGERGSAVLYADKLLQLRPDDPQVIALRNSLAK
jgi:tetratricopeptide (TPR) repeat protein